MAEFYVTAVGNRGEATRLGTKSSGVRATVQTWGSVIRTRQYMAPSGFGHEASIDLEDTHGNRALSLHMDADTIVRNRQDAGVAIALGLVREAVEHLNDVAAKANESKVPA